MPNTILDKAIAAVPKFGNRIELFTKKLHLAQYADNSIYDSRLKIAQAVLFYKKLPDDCTQVVLIFTTVKKLKPWDSNFPPVFTILLHFV